MYMYVTSYTHTVVLTYCFHPHREHQWWHCTLRSRWSVCGSRQRISRTLHHPYCSGQVGDASPRARSSKWSSCHFGERVNMLCLWIHTFGSMDMNFWANFCLYTRENKLCGSSCLGYGITWLYIVCTSQNYYSTRSTKYNKTPFTFCQVRIIMLT